MNTLERISELLRCLENNGMILFPSPIGYGLLATEERAIRRIYELKERPFSKPSGVAASPKIFKDLVTSHHKNVPTLLTYPVGIIDQVNQGLPIIKKTSSFLKNGDTIAFFFHIQEWLSELADRCYANGQLLMITSANKAGTGNAYAKSDIHQDFISEADLYIDDNSDHFKKLRGKFENTTNTILDLVNGKILRAGLFAHQISSWAEERGLLHGGALREIKNPAIPSSILFLLSHKEKLYDQLQYFQQADWLVLDLQDSCPLKKRKTARQLIQKFMDADYPVEKPVYIRCNELSEKKELKADFSLDYTERITGFWLPMLTSAKDVKKFEKKIAAIEKRCGLKKGHFRFVVIIESSEAVKNIFDIAGASSRNIAIIVGHADLTADTGSTRNDFSIGMVRHQVVLAARANNILALDTPYTEIHDYQGLLVDSQKARELGMDAKVALHPQQVDFINQAFSLSEKEYSTLKKDINYFNSTEGGILRNPNTKLLAPPFIKKMQKDLKRKVYKKKNNNHNAESIRFLDSKFSSEDLYVGQIIKSRFPTIIDLGWISQWKTLVNNCYRIQNDKKFAKGIGFKTCPVPYQALINFALCDLVNVFSIHCKYHLGISNVKLVRPVYPGVSLSASMCITKIEPTSSKKFTIVHNNIILSDKSGKVVLQMERTSLFDYFLPQKAEKPIPKKFHSRKRTENLKKIYKQLHKTKSSPSGLALKSLSGISLLGHKTQNKIDLSLGTIYCNLFRNSHPVHSNGIRFGDTNLAISGGLVLPLVCSIVANDLVSVYREEIEESIHLNPVRDGDVLGAMSYILASRAVSSSIYELDLCTYGIRNVDVREGLAESKIPLDLFLLKKIRPKEIERVLLSSNPKLSSKLVIRILWRIQIGVN